MTTIPTGSGLSTQLVAKDESTYGVAPSLTSGVDSFEINSDSLELKKTVVQGMGLAAGRVYPRTKRRVLTNYDAGGSLPMDLPTRNLGFWLRYMIGAFSQTPSQIASTGIYQTVFQPVTTQFGHSFTIQKGVPATDATVQPFTYVGGKLTQWEIGVATGALASLNLTVDARNELAGAGNGDPLNGSVPALAFWNVPTNGLGLSVFHFREATLFSGGTPTLGAGILLVSPPAVPATTVAAVNPYGMNAWVTISAGTLTSVVVNGVQVGTTAGSYLVPSGGSISITYSVAPTWVWHQAVVTLAGETAIGNVKDVTIQKQYSYDSERIFVGSSGYKSEPIENGFRSITGSLTAEFTSGEALYNAFAADTTTSLQLTFTGPTVSSSNYLLDIIIPNIKFEGESPKVPGPSVVTLAANFTGLDDETTVPIQVTYQSEDVTF